MNKSFVRELEKEGVLRDLIESYYDVDELQEINIFGIRWENKNDEFDDLIGYFSNEKIMLVNATTEPGRYYTDNPINEDGAARLSLGFHKNLWKRGKHKNSYNALIQASRVKVIRDSNQNMESDYDDIEDEGMFGINLHRASVDHIVNNIGKYSAGCQVIQDPFSYKMFLDNVYLAKQDLFSYFLLSGEAL